MRVTLYALLWAVGSAALVGLLQPPPQQAPVEARATPEPPAPPPTVAAVAATAKPVEPPGPSPELIEEGLGAAQLQLNQAREAALGYADMDRGPATLREAAAALDQAPDTALALVDRILETQAQNPLADRALWLRGDALARAGDWEAAAEAWNQVGDSPVEDYLELRRAQALLELGQASEAADRASLLVDELADTTRQTLHLARELRLKALFAAERYAEYLARADDFLDIYGEYPREDQVWFRMGQSHLALGDHRDAARHFDRVVWIYPYRPLANAAWLTLRTLAAAGVDVPHHSLDERFEQANDIRRKRHWQVAEALLSDLLRDVIDAQGETRLAGEIRMAQFRNAYSAGDFVAALEHLTALNDAGRRAVSSHEYFSKLSDTFARLGQFEAGADAIRERDHNRSGARRHLELAEYYFDNGFFEESVAHYRESLSERSRRGWDFSLLLFMAGEYDEARDHFEALADRAGGSTWRRYQYWLGRSLQELDDYAAARVALEAVVAANADGYYGLQARNRILEMDRSEPPPLLAGAVDLPLVDEGAEPGTAHPALDELASTALRTLSLQLTDLVRRRAVDEPAPSLDGPPARFERPARFHWDGPDGVADARLALAVSDHEIESAYWIPPDPEAFERLTEEYSDLFPELERADFLFAVGSPHDARVEAREASIELRALERTFARRRPTRSRPIRLRDRELANYVDRRSHDTGFWGIRLGGYRYPVPDDRAGRNAVADRQIAIYDARVELREAFRQGLMTLGDFNFVRRFAFERSGWSNTQPDGEARSDWSEAYARAYPDLVTRWSEHYGLNPYVMWALMRIETSFNPDSISRANARGLLQVIPMTGELISQRLEYWDFGPQNLMRPALSIEYGTYYYSELMTKFHGQEMLAFAGYNGGPFNVARWLEGRGELPMDAFIETIPFDEARNYAKNAYRYINLYRRIYLGEPHLYLGNDIDPEYELNIHF